MSHRELIRKTVSWIIVNFLCSREREREAGMNRKMILASVETFQYDPAYVRPRSSRLARARFESRFASRSRGTSPRSREQVAFNGELLLLLLLLLFIALFIVTIKRGANLDGRRSKRRIFSVNLHAAVNAARSTDGVGARQVLSLN